MHSNESRYEPLEYTSGSVSIFSCTLINTTTSPVLLKSVARFIIHDSTFITTCGSTGGAMFIDKGETGDISRCCAYGTYATTEAPAFVIRSSSMLLAELNTVARIPSNNKAACTNEFFNIANCTITLLNVSHVNCPEMKHAAGTLFGATITGSATMKKSIFQHIECNYGLLWIQNWNQEATFGHQTVEDCILANCKVQTRSLVIGYGLIGNLTRTIFRDNEYPVLFERVNGSHAISHCWTERAIECIGGNVDVQRNNKVGRGPTKQPHYYTNTLCVAPTYVFSQQPIRRLRDIIRLGHSFGVLN